MLIIADSIGNTDKAIAGSLACLVRSPDQLELLRQNPELMPLAVNECLRMESPTQYVGRLALEDLTIQGVRINKGDAVFLVLGSANRDPEFFEAPNVLDIKRTPNPYLSFGKGRHSCIGKNLSRRQIEKALGILVNRLDDIKFSEDRLEWVPRLAHRWLKKLPVTFTVQDRP
jgi:pimeloyl-[acyl-carrier protein] synthase